MGDLDEPTRNLLSREMSVGFDNRRLSAVSGFHALYSGGFIIVVFVTYVKTHTHKCLAHAFTIPCEICICMYIATMVFMIIVIYDNDDGDDDGDDMTTSSVVSPTTTTPPPSPRR